MDRGYQSPPDTDMLHGVIDEFCINIGYGFQSTCLKRETDDLHRNLVNIFHHKITRMERTSDQMNYQIRMLIRKQDGSEVKSEQLEQLTAKAQKNSTTIEYFETIRDHAAKLTPNTPGNAGCQLKARKPIVRFYGPLSSMSATTSKRKRSSRPQRIVPPAIRSSSPEGFIPIMPKSISLWISYISGIPIWFCSMVAH